MAKEPEAATGGESTAADDAQAQADFDAGAATVQETKTPPRDDAGRFAAAPPEKKPEDKPAAKPADKPADPPPEYVQLTKQQLERLEIAAKRTDDIETKFSKAFGTIGDVQKIVRSLQTQTPRGAAVKIPDGAFADMEKDFPELAKHTRAVLEATLKGLEGTGGPAAKPDADVTEEFGKKIEERVRRLQTEELEDAYPDWQKIVGAVDVTKGEQPDPNNAFRKWLAGKDKAYQERVNNTNSAGVITRAIRLFKRESKVAPPAPKPDQQASARASRIAEAVRPRGDGGHPPGKDEDEEFQAGFKSG